MASAVSVLRALRSSLSRSNRLTLRHRHPSLAPNGLRTLSTLSSLSSLSTNTVHVPAAAIAKTHVLPLALPLRWFSSTFPAGTNSVSNHKATNASRAMLAQPNRRLSSISNAIAYKQQHSPQQQTTGGSTAPGISHLVKERRILLATQKRNRRFALYGLGGLVFGACVFAAIYSFQDVFMFYLTPSELHERMGSLSDKSGIRLGGLVLEGSVKLPPAHPMVEFVVTDLNADILVQFHGLLPDLFREGKSVVVEGKFDKAAATFIASNVLAKHDENYMPKEVAEALAKNRESKALLDEARYIIEQEELQAAQKEHVHGTKR